MSTPKWTDERSRLIAMAAPEVPEATSQELERVWAMVKADMPGPDGARLRCSYR